MQKIEITNPEDLKKDISDLLARADSLSDEARSWFAKAYTREVLREGHYTKSETNRDVLHVRYMQSDSLQEQSHYILDWLAELSERNPRLHAKLPRINFKQAHEHSEKWHAALAKAAEKSERYIEPDEENAPKVLDLDDGWEVFWLKTDLARDIEGDVMGHCVGGGGYDQLEPGRAIFSVRKNNIAHLTLDLSGRGIVQAVTKGNGEVPERYQWLVNTVALKLTAALILSLDPVHVGTLSDGRKQGPSGDIAYLKNGLLHREDGPALIRSDGRKSWWANGLLHRKGAPAVENGKDYSWWVNGKKHREDGPAVKTAKGYEAWYMDGLLHREDGPAIIEPDGTQSWYRKGKLHREDGPARIKDDGTKYWYREGNLHREDGPAIIFASGEKQWWVKNELHREDGPAVILADGRKEWWQNNQRHREDGPAEVNFFGVVNWYYRGEIHREDGPARIHPDGTKEWYRHGKLHREDGPAFVSRTVSIWYENGKAQREDGSVKMAYRSGG